LANRPPIAINRRGLDLPPLVLSRSEIDFDLVRVSSQSAGRSDSRSR